MKPILPQPLKAEVTVNVNLPPEATNLMQDLHQDRAGIALGGVVLLVCVILATLKYLRSK